MEREDKELLDYINMCNIKNIAYLGNVNIDTYFDSYFNLIKINNIDNSFLLKKYDLLILPIGLRGKLKDKKIYCLYYDEGTNINFGILNNKIFKNMLFYKEKYFLNDFFFNIIKGFEIDKIIFGNIYIKEINVERFKLVFSNGIDVYIDTLKDNKCYFNFGKIQLLVNYKKIKNRKELIIGKLLLKIAIKRIEFNLKIITNKNFIN